MTRGLHQARLSPWTPDELKAHLATLVDALLREKDPGAGVVQLARPHTPYVSPLDIAAELLGGELEAFVLFGRMGHLDPPRGDGKVPIAIMRRMSEDPEIDARIRETAKKWVLEQEKRS